MPGFSQLERLRGLLVVAVVFCAHPAAWCEEDATSPDPQTPNVTYSVFSESGLFFLNGKYIEAPYQIEATEASIRVNGIVCAVESKPPFQGLGYGSEFGEGFRGRGMRGGFGNRNRFRHRDFSEDQEFRREDRSEEETAQIEDFQQRAEFRSRSDFRPRGEFRPRADFDNRRNAQRIVAALNERRAVLLFEQTGELIEVPQVLALDFYEVLLTEPSDRELIPKLANLELSQETSEIWNEWLRNYIPSETEQILLTQHYNDRKQLENQNHRAVAAIRRLESFSYPLTLLGMIVGVVALGHLLRWPRKGDLAEAGSETVRAVEIALWLMMGMALIDLVWTILASQAGMMREVNPLAEKLVDSPLQLSIFKTFATAVGFGIFYLWRQRQQIQVATWWMCLVCVLVTFRWIIFDSVISP